MQILLLLLIGFISIGSTVNGDDVIIYPLPNNQQTLQQIINFVAENTIILIKPGIYHETLIIEKKAVHLIAQKSDLVVEFQSPANGITLLYCNGGGGQIKGIVFTEKSGSRDGQEKPPGIIDLSNCTFRDIGNGIVHRFPKISIVGVVVIRAQWYSISLRGLEEDHGITVHDIFILDSGYGLIFRETNGVFVFWDIVCRNNENGGLIIFDTLSGPLIIAGSTFVNNRIADVHISNSHAVIVLASSIMGLKQ